MLRTLATKAFASTELIENVAAYSVFTILFSFALLWFKERLLMDSGYYIFHVINTGSFWIMHDRLVLGISQLLPLLGLKAGLGLKEILLLYSVGHVVYFFALYAIVVLLLKDNAAGLTLVVLQTVGIVHSFFTPMFELYYGAGLLVLFYALLKQHPQKPFVIFLLGALEVLILTSHPMGFILLLFILALEFAGNRNCLKLYGLFLLILAVVAIFKFLDKSSYEQEKMTIFFSRYFTLTNIDYIKKLMGYLVSGYGDVLFFFATSLYFYIYKRFYFKAALLFLFFAGMIVLISSTYDGTAGGRYMEQVYFPIVCISAIPFLYDCLFKVNKQIRLALTIVLFAIIAGRLTGIYQASATFKMHTAQMKRLINQSHQLGGSKFIINTQNTARSYSWGNWSDPVEIFLTSALDGRENTVSIIRLEDYLNESNQKKLNDSSFIFRLDEVLNYSDLESNYFQMEPGNYKFLNNSSQLSDFPPDFINNIRLKVDEIRNYKPGKEVYIPVYIINRNALPLFSELESGFYLTYHLTKNGVPIDNGKNPLTPLEVDIVSAYIQDMIVDIPANKGYYELIPVLKWGSSVIYESSEKLKFNVE